MLTGVVERFGEEFSASESEWNDHKVETFERLEFVLLLHLYHGRQSAPLNV